MQGKAGNILQYSVEALPFTKKYTFLQDFDTEEADANANVTLQEEAEPDRPAERFVADILLYFSQKHHFSFAIIPRLSRILCLAYRC